MVEHEKWMRRCLQLAALGASSAAPNPMVGAVLVLNGRILAEGWHRKAGEPHAEVECLRAFGEGPVPEQAVLYVNLEPCAHHGRTPPCAELLIQRNVRHVVIGHRDPFPLVAGKGVDLLRKNGITVVENILADECRWFQRRFLTSVEQGRPYVVLKWARSADGFLDQHPRTLRNVQRISSPTSDVLVHKWRTEEQAILVGSKTVLNDNPTLTARHVEGRQPLRVVLDRKGISPEESKVFDKTTPTLFFTTGPRRGIDVEQVIVPPGSDPVAFILNELHQRSIRSVLVEGGAELLQHFIRSGKWDEARVISSAVKLARGTAAPVLGVELARTEQMREDRLDFYVNGSTSLKGTVPPSEWAW